MKIRKATLKDYKFIKECKDAMFIQHHAYDSKVFADEYEYDYFTFLMDLLRGYHVISTLDNGDPVGYVFYTLRQIDNSLQRPTKSLFIQEFFINHNHRRSHIGQHMMEYINTIAKELHCTCVKLYCYNKNLCGMSFYDSCGFQKQYTTLMRYVE